MRVPTASRFGEAPAPLRRCHSSSSLSSHSSAPSTPVQAMTPLTASLSLSPCAPQSVTPQLAPAVPLPAPQTPQLQLQDAELQLHTSSSSNSVTGSNSFGSSASSVASFTHDPYSWHESKPPCTPVQDVQDPPRLDTSFTEMVAPPVSSLSFGAGSSPYPLLPAPAPAALVPMLPRSMHTIVKRSPNDRIGAWIRGNAVTNVMEDGPAEAAGLQVGMRVLEVEGKAADPATVSAIIRKLWREVGAIHMLLEAQPAGTRSKRCLAKARARQRSRIAAAVRKISEDDTTSSTASIF